MKTLLSSPATSRSFLARGRPWLLACLLSIVALGSTSADAAEVIWTLRSSTSGDLPVPNVGDEQTCCLVADIDSDGVKDFIVGERTQVPSVVWYKYNGKGWSKHVIDNTLLRPEAGGAIFDVDGDGDLDVVLGQDSRGSSIWWWENPSPRFDKPWTRREIKNSGARKHHDQTVGDFDGDGRVELVSWNQKASQLLMFEIPDNPRSAGPWPSTAIYEWTSGAEHEGFPSQPVDVDLDGKPDLIGGGRWFKHTGGTAFQARVIDDSMRFTQCAAGQLIKGGRPEIVFSPGDADGEAKWFEWAGGGWKAHSLAFVIHGHTCDVGDVDGDGNLDIMIGEMGDPGAGDEARILIWYGDGQGHFKQTIASSGQGIHEGILDDLDGDGDLDILVKPYHHNSPRIDILLNGSK
jgi:hypothetical protein